MSFTRVSSLDALWPGDMLGVRVSGQRVLLVRDDTQVCAYEDRCAHLGMPLSEGTLEGHVLTCAVHGWSYDTRTGRGVNPAKACLKRFALQVRNEEIWVDLDVASEAAHE